MLVFNFNLTLLISCASGLYIWPFFSNYFSQYKYIYSCFNILDNTICKKRVTFYILLNWWLILQIWFHTFHMFLLTPHLQLALGVDLHAFFFILGSWSLRWILVGFRHMKRFDSLDIKWILNTYGTYLLWTQVEVIVSVFGRGVNSSFSCQWSNSVPY